VFIQKNAWEKTQKLRLGSGNDPNNGNSVADASAARSADERPFWRMRCRAGAQVFAAGGSGRDLGPKLF